VVGGANTVSATNFSKEEVLDRLKAISNACQGWLSIDEGKQLRRLIRGLEKKRGIR
jgi:hypothetical protein